MTDINGQLVLGRDCAWCSNAGVKEIVLEPEHKVGERFVAARKAWVCVRHMDLGKEGPMGAPRRRVDRRYVQTDILSALDDGSAKGSAILDG